MLAKEFSGINRKCKGSKKVNINAKFVGQRFKLGRNLTKTDRTKRKKYLKFIDWVYLFIIFYAILDTNYP